MKTKIQYIILFMLLFDSIFATTLKVESTPVLQLTTTQLTYNFTLQQPMTVIMHHWNSESKKTRITLKDSDGNIIDSKYGSSDMRDSPCIDQSYMRKVLPAGTYTAISERFDNKGITLKIEGTPYVRAEARSNYPSPEEGDERYGMADMGKLSSNFTYIDVRDTRMYDDDWMDCYLGTYFSYSNGTFYEFDLDKPMDIIIDTHLSDIFATNIHLFHCKYDYVIRNGEPFYEYVVTLVQSEYGYFTYWDSVEKTAKARMKIDRLPAGNYLLHTEGSEYRGNAGWRAINGIVVTSVEGRAPEGDCLDYPIDIGEFDDVFSVRDEKDSYHYAAYSEQESTLSGQDVFYQFTTHSPMDITLSSSASGAPTDIFLYKIENGERSRPSQGTTGNLQMNNLPAGTYIVSSKLRTLASAIGVNIITQIAGVPSQTTETIKEENYIASRKNRIRKFTPLVETSSIAGLNENQRLKEVHYYDGLGRPEQIIHEGITPSKKDLVVLTEYDSYGRQAATWLPFIHDEGESDTFVYQKKVKRNIKSQYEEDQAPYSMPVYEASPLDRVLEQYGPGADWHNDGKKVSTDYMINTGSSLLNCIKYTVGGTNQVPALTKGSNYSTGQLFVTEVKDEDGNTSYEFKDKLGQVVLTRQMDGSTRHDTYYVYNNFGNLCYVLPPRIDDEGIAAAKLNELAYQYRYDDRNRCIYKKLPGCEPVYYVYDKADQLIFTQDGELRAQNANRWLFSIPDALGRIVLTGTCTITLNYAATNPVNAVVKTTRANGTNTYKGYATPSGVTFTLLGILSVNYYDDYAFLGYNGVPNTTDTQYNTQSGYGTCYGDHQAANASRNKGLLTGTLTAQMNSDGTLSSTYLYSVMYYDNRGRVVQTKSNNHLTGGLEKEYIAYNFTGQPTKRMHVHSATGKTTQTEVYTYTYDHAGRLLTTKHKLNTGSEVTLASNTYDELGRLKTNQKHTHANLKTTYAYNIRSWTKSITNPLFNQTLYYNDKVTAHSYSDYQQQYNGNISGMEWQLNGESKRSYRFKYDQLSRLLHAGYNGVINGGMYNTSYTYDKHGNIKTLTRRGKNSSATDNNVAIDQLTLTYSGNQLTNVADAITNFAYAESADFKDKVSASTSVIEYTYNKNGAMETDLNKGITKIQYNSLNLPRQMVINSSTAKAKNYYTYSASDVKLKTEQRYDPTLNSSPVGTTTPANDGFSEYKNTDYVGNIIYETTKNSVNTTTKIRILVDGGYIEGGVYYFYLADHLGNNRVVANSSGVVQQKTHYYPFGTAFAENTGRNVQPYKYNGKELDQMHGLNLYDYNARYMESAIGRFTTVDPLAEKYYSISPYAYVANNPLKYIDPDGRKIIGTNGKPVSYSEKKGWSKNTSPDIQRIGESLLMTKKGTERLNAMLKSNVKINMKLSSEKKIENGGLIAGKVNKVIFTVVNGKVSAKSLDLTIYEGSIKDLTDHNGEYYDEIVDGLSVDEAIGAIAGHESEHTEDENLQQQFDNQTKGANHDVEKKPDETKKQISDELKDKK